MFERYYRIPYKEGGRDWDGCDCWGFVRLVLLEEGKAELPLFRGVCTNSEFMQFKESFHRIDKPADFCLVQLRPIGSFAHIGLYWQGNILHMTRSGVAMQSADRIPNLIKGYYSTQV